jgi:hypothetical protein
MLEAAGDRRRVGGAGYIQLSRWQRRIRASSRRRILMPFDWDATAAVVTELVRAAMED